MSKFLIVFEVEGNNYTKGNFGIDIPTRNITAKQLPNIINAIQEERKSQDGIIITNIIKLG